MLKNYLATLLVTKKLSRRTEDFYRSDLHRCLSFKGAMSLYMSNLKIIRILHTFSPIASLSLSRYVQVSAVCP
ncbi:hypothetical protein RRG08_036096 [Elysia crispata]|uniref:Uncharacterized protein n=1 Tax=Elysia crispata TaxID=231223 RepID=A0AAE1ALD7_9GAST|nr:hypothetical protein RRG08_036096 [Elysia crispata]